MANLPKIGEVIEGNARRWIVTARYPHGANFGGGMGFAVMTPIPDGCEPEDLGRKFFAAEVTYAEVETNEKLATWIEPNG